MIIVHQEVSPHLHRTVQMIRDLNKKGGVALNPSTPLIALEEILEELNLVLAMTVNPGFGGQRFIKSTLPMIGRLRRLLQEKELKSDLEVDGGIVLLDWTVELFFERDVSELAVSETRRG